MAKINFFSNGSCKNHGCEAIYLSLMNILGENEYTIFTEYFTEDQKILNNELSLINIYENKNTWISNMLYKIKYKIKKDDKLYFDYKYKPFYKNLHKSNELFLSVGGDNYCYGYNYWLKSLNEYVQKKDNDIILTGCSLEPDSLNDEMINTLSSFKAIIARESITYNALIDKKIKNVFLKPDPAFVLPTDKINVDNDMFFKKEIIGINISPLVFKNDAQAEIIFKNINCLINYIINNTTYNIMFIPHVLIEDNNDYDIMKKFINDNLETNRVKIIKSESATELKGYISKCKIMIAARTHASIAAYSNCIPTLVLGYSIKSKGIAKDLFGTDENYVIPIGKISDEKNILEGFNFINENYENIKNHLEKIMPDYKRQCLDIKEIIGEYL